MHAHTTAGADQTPGRPSMHSRRVHGASALGIVSVVALVLAGCGAGQPDPEPVTDPAPEAVTTAPTPEAEPEASDEPLEATEAEGPDAPERSDGPVETYLAWLEASRVPEAETACGHLTDGLVEKMLEEYETVYGVATTCEDLTVQSAELYRQFGIGAEVSVDVVEQTETEATLFVTYLDDGECGTIVLEHTGARWLINEQSEGCAAG